MMCASLRPQSTSSTNRPQQLPDCERHAETQLSSDSTMSRVDSRDETAPGLPWPSSGAGAPSPAPAPPSSASSSGDDAVGAAGAGVGWVGAGVASATFSMAFLLFFLENMPSPFPILAVLDGRVRSGTNTKLPQGEETNVRAPK